MGRSSIVGLIILRCCTYLTSPLQPDVNKAKWLRRLDSRKIHVPDLLLWIRICYERFITHAFPGDSTQYMLTSMCVVLACHTPLQYTGSVYRVFTARCITVHSARGIAIVIRSVCLSLCYVRAPWLNRLLFSQNNITTNPTIIRCSSKIRCKFSVQVPRIALCIPATARPSCRFYISILL